MVAGRITPPLLRRLPTTAVAGAGSACVALAAVVVAYAQVGFALGLVLIAPLCAMLSAMSMAATPMRRVVRLLVGTSIGLAGSAPVVVVAARYDGLAGALLQLVALCVAVAWIGVAAPSAARRVRVDPAISGTILLLVALAWLTMPVWMSRGFHTHAGLWLIDHTLALHPIFALNAAFGLGDWSHQPLAYTYLTTLGQDVPFALPGSAWICVLAHGLAGALAMALARSDAPPTEDERAPR